MISYHLLTNPGERDHNEDYIGMWNERGIYWFLLADGLGGHGMGEVASKCVVETALANIRNSVGTIPMNSLFESSQEALLNQQAEMGSFSEMKTTMVALCIDANGAQFSHVGDSRGYYFEGNKFRFVTHDHSVPRMLADARKIKEKDIPHHPDRNKLLRVMGIEWEDPQEEIDKPIGVNIKKSQAFLLCSDGFWEWISEKDMQHCLKHAHDAKEWIESMQEIVVKSGKGKGMDNYSAIGIIISE